MTSQATRHGATMVFTQRRTKGKARWFVQIACNFLEPRVYGPFPDADEAERFREGAEFELRKLLDCQLPAFSSDAHVNQSLNCL